MGDTRRDTPLARKDARPVDGDAPASSGRTSLGKTDVRASGIEERIDDRSVRPPVEKYVARWRRRPLFRLLLIAGAAVLVFVLAWLLHPRVIPLE